MFEANCDLSLYPIRGTHKDLINDITSSQNLVQDPALVDKIAKLHGLQPHIPFAFQADLELQMAEKKIPQFVLAPSNGRITLRHIFQNPVKKSKNSHSTQGQSLHVLHSQTVSNNLFVLSQQPNQVQRKAYQTETR